MHPGRNDPCPCGSGNKYKKCCGRAIIAPMDPGVSRASAVRALDLTLTERLVRFARIRLGRDWIQYAVDSYTGGASVPIDDAELGLAIPFRGRCSICTCRDMTSHSLACSARKGGIGCLRNSVDCSMPSLTRG